MRIENTDWHIQNHGSIVLLHPETDEAREWVDERLEVEGWQWWAGSIAVEPRMAHVILTAYYHETINPEWVQ